MRQDKNQESTKEVSVQSVIRALELLKIFSYKDVSISFKEICARSSLPKSTTHRLLSSLKAEGFIEQDFKTGNYSLGIEVIRLGGMAIDRLDLIKFARPYMEQLTKQTENTSNLYIRREYSRVCVEQVPGFGYVRRYSYLGASFPLYAGASGKVFLAYSSPEFLEQYFKDNPLEKITDITVTDKKQLLCQLEDIRKKGYSCSIAEREVDTASVACPIFDYRGKIVAAVTISGLAHYFSEERVKEYVGYLMDASGKISHKMGYCGPQ